MSEELQLVLLATSAVLMVLIALTGFVLVVRDTVSGRCNWGVNLRPVVCPRCGEPAPLVRKPANSRQFWWGGATCAECGTEYDKWGTEVAAGPLIPLAPKHAEMRRKLGESHRGRGGKDGPTNPPGDIQRSLDL